MSYSNEGMRDDYLFVSSMHEEFMHELKEVQDQTTVLNEQKINTVLETIESGTRIFKGQLEQLADVAGDNPLLVPLTTAKLTATGAKTTAAAVADAMTNTGLAFRLEDGTKYPLSVHALKSLRDRSGSDCRGVSWLYDPANQSKFIEVLNILLKATPSSKSIVIIRNGKIVSIQSDAGNGYNYIDSYDSLVEASKYVRTAGGKFVKGTFSNEFMTATFTLDLLKEDFDSSYDRILASRPSAKKEDLMPCIKISTSDVSTSAMRIKPMLLADNKKLVPILKSVDIVHQKGCTKTVTEALNEAYTLFGDVSEKLKNLAGINISYPLETFQNIFNGETRELKLTVPAKYWHDAYELFEVTNAGKRCTAHDVYMAACDVISYAENAECSQSRLSDLENEIGKLLNYTETDWNTLDFRPAAVEDRKEAE